jgi:hypothetical protein
MPDAERLAADDVEELEALTVQACRAAEQGDWDQVERCVNRRGRLLEERAVPPVSSDRLVALDTQIRMLAMTARTAVETILVELGQTRRNLRQLQQGNMRREPERSRFMNVKA